MRGIRWRMITLFFGSSIVHLTYEEDIDRRAILIIAFEITILNVDVNNLQTMISFPELDRAHDNHFLCSKEILIMDWDDRHIVASNDRFRYSCGFWAQTMGNDLVVGAFFGVYGYWRRYFRDLDACILCNSIGDRDILACSAEWFVRIVVLIYLMVDYV